MDNSLSGLFLLKRIGILSISPLLSPARHSLLIIIKSNHNLTNQSIISPTKRGKSPSAYYSICLNDLKKVDSLESQYFSLTTALVLVLSARNGLDLLTVLVVICSSNQVHLEVSVVAWVLIP